MLIDTHAHLQDEQCLILTGPLSLSRALAAGVGRIINIGDTISNHRPGAVKLADDYPEIYAAVGIHPQEAGKMHGVAR